jgi:biopolymer transport protein ExbD
VRFAPPRRAGADITLTPLIDILFIVLLFLVLTATFTEETVLRIALPRTATGERGPNDPGTVRILVEADGTVYLDGHVRTLDEVGRRLQTIVDKDGTRVAVAADERASHGRVIHVVDLVRQAGIFRLDIETFSDTIHRESP